MTTGAEPAEALLDLVHRDPRAAIVAAATRLDDASTATERATALWARGMARRELQELDDARADLELARSTATTAGDVVLAARIAVTESLVELYLGDEQVARARLESAIEVLDGVDRARAVMQRALVNHRQGRVQDAAGDYLAALDVLERDGDLLAAARAHANVAALYAATLDTTAAIEHAERAVELGERLDQPLLVAGSLHNLAYALARAGRLAESIDAFTVAEQRLTAIGDTQMLLALRVDYVDVLVQANLIADARREAELVLAQLERGSNVVEIADAALTVARCRLAAADTAGAHAAATRAAELFAQHGREPLVALADAVLLHADVAVTGPSADIADRAELLGDTLGAAGWTTEAASVIVLAGRTYLELRDLEAAERVLARVAHGAAGSTAERAAAALATAMLHEARGDRGDARRAIADGIRVVVGNQASLGAVELRALATAHGAALAELGMRLAAADGDAIELLRHVESLRAVAALLPRPAPPGDDALAAALVELRTVVGDARSAAAAGMPRRVLAARRPELEARIRRASHRGGGAADTVEVPVERALAALGDSVLVEYAELDGRCIAVSSVDGELAMHDVAAMDELRDDADAITFALHRLQRTVLSEASRAAALQTLDEVGDRLVARVVGVELGDRPLVVVPCGPLHGLAWGALPALRGRAVTVRPSLLAGLDREAAPATSNGVVLVAGPRLPAAPTEVAALARLHPAATVLQTGEATVDHCLTALDGAALAHLACHGRFRVDNPLFSSIELDDGDLTVYDLERCRVLPPTVVLSACDAAASTVLRGGSLLGLAAALTELGVRSIIAPLTPVSDERTVEVMVDLHRELVGGASAPVALARATVAGGAFRPHAASFVAIG